MLCNSPVALTTGQGDPSEGHTGDESEGLATALRNRGGRFVRRDVRANPVSAKRRKQCGKPSGWRTSAAASANRYSRFGKVRREDARFRGPSPPACRHRNDITRDSRHPSAFGGAANRMDHRRLYGPPALQDAHGTIRTHHPVLSLSRALRGTTAPTRACPCDNEQPVHARDVVA